MPRRRTRSNRIDTHTVSHIELGVLSLRGVRSRHFRAVGLVFGSCPLRGSMSKYCLRCTDLDRMSCSSYYHHTAHASWHCALAALDMATLL